MLASLGYGALVITFLMSLYGVGAAIYGVTQNKANWVDSSRNAMLLTFPLITISALSIILLLVQMDFQVEYVANVTSRSMPMYLRITALWGGQEGSLVFWAWLMAAFASAATLRDWKRDREFLPWVVVVSLVTLAFFLFLIIFFENPFMRLWQANSGELISAIWQPANMLPFTPADGRGLNPLLRHPGMIIHPPMLYLGFVSFVIPFAFAIAALITGRTDDRWIRVTRRWTLWAWLFLSLGLVLGGRWAYDVLGWGGYWGWDPVEVASFLPWLSGTAFLHSVMIQEKRGMFKRWNMLLIILTYDLVLYSTFLVRSGVLSSVHAFAQSPLGPAFFVFIAFTFFVSIWLLIHRWKDLHEESHINSYFSREALFLLNNLVFMALLVICFIGLNYPLFTEATGIIGQRFPSLAYIFTGQKAVVGPLWYESRTALLWVALLLLMGIAPMSAWGASTARSLGKKLWIPGIVSLAAPVILAFYGIGLAALLTFWLLALVVLVTLFEFWQGTSARMRSKGESLLLAFWTLVSRNRRRYGGYSIHLGIVLMAVGIIGIEVFQTETQGTVPLGGEMVIGDYSVTYDSLAEFNTDDGRNVARAVLSVYKDGEYLTELYPRRDFYFESEQAMTIPGVRSSIEDDFYVLLVDWQPISTQNATFKIYRNPLVNWLWFGSAILILGTLVAAWPEKEAALVREPRRIQAHAPASAD